MKKIFTSFFITISAFVAIAQQDAQFSQNMFNRLVVNPGYAGANDAICATMLGRNQWMGFGQGSPKTYLLSLDAAVPALRGGVGLNVMQDQVGFINTSMFNAGYAYRHQLGRGTLGVGFNVGFVSTSIRGSWNSIDPWASDVAIPNEGVSDLVLDAAFGVYYQTNEYYVGLSSTHIPASTISGSGTTLGNYDLNLDLGRHYYFMAGYSFVLPNAPDIEVKPSVFVKSDISTTQYDINCNVFFQRMAWGGLTYRVQDALVAMVGFQTGNVKIGYAYDLTTSRMGRSGESGRMVNTHEIMLGYCFKIIPKPKVSIHRNTRFL
jgi:type IX secretion system PorP/SprF family membrane protein